VNCDISAGAVARARYPREKKADRVVIVSISLCRWPARIPGRAAAVPVSFASSMPSICNRGRVGAERNEIHVQQSLERENGSASGTTAITCAQSKRSLRRSALAWFDRLSARCFRRPDSRSGVTNEMRCRRRERSFRFFYYRQQERPGQAGNVKTNRTSTPALLDSIRPRHRCGDLDTLQFSLSPLRP